MSNEDQSNASEQNDFLPELDALLKKHGYEGFIVMLVKDKKQEMFVSKSLTLVAATKILKMAHASTRNQILVSMGDAPE